MSASPDAPAPPPIGTAAPRGSRRRVFAVRLVSTLFLWAFISAALIFSNPWPFYILLTVLAIGAYREYLWMDRELPKAYSISALAVALGYTISLLAISSQPSGARENLAVADMIFGVLAIATAFVPTLFGKLDGRKTLWYTIFTAFGFFCIPWLFGFMARILFLPWGNGAGGISHPNTGLIYGLFLVLATKFTDAGAYAFGSLWGRNKLIPNISPAKTWEGLGGAFTGSVIAGMTAFALARDSMPLLTWASAFILCLLIALVSVLGDLSESVVKRCLGAKDSGKLLPGIGGAYDLVDSLLFTAPVMYFFLSYAC